VLRAAVERLGSDTNDGNLLGMSKPGVVLRGLALVTAWVIAVSACGNSTNNGAEATKAGTSGRASGGTTSSSGGSDATAAGRAGGPSDAGGMSGSGGVAGAAACVGLACDVPSCPAGTTTSISGKVFDPSQTLPIYKATVFVPNGFVPELAAGAVCDRCGATDMASVTRTTTDRSGNFTLTEAPAGKNIPVVVQIGKWRRQLQIPSVEPCQQLSLEPERTRLPRNQAEGDMPRIAISAGAQDQMECLPRRLGIDDAEFTTVEGDGRVHLFTGHYIATGPTAVSPITHFAPDLNGGATLPSSDTLWGNVESLKKYDLVILSCEGDAFENSKTPAMRQAMYDYLSQGGRVLASHYHHVWFSKGPMEVMQIGSWKDRRDPSQFGDASSATVNQGFPDGKVLADWLVEVGASLSAGSLSILYAKDSLQAGTPKLSREWLTLENPNYPTAPKSVQYLSFTAPVGAPLAATCGKAVFTDLHVTATEPRSAKDPPLLGFPLDCEDRGLLAQEKAVAFMLFQLGSCIDASDIP
jgi:hypothetical protein